MLVITSANKKPQGYGKTQFRYALTYIIITSVVLLILNIYCSSISQKLFYKSKEAAMIEKCQLASDEISNLDVLNAASVAQIINQMESLKITRLIVTDQKALVLYDSLNASIGQYAILPEIMQALGKNSLGSYGNDVFSWTYVDGIMDSVLPRQLFITILSLAAYI